MAPWVSPVLCLNGGTKRHLHGRLRPRDIYMEDMRVVEASRLFNKFTALTPMNLLKTFKKIYFEAVQLE